MGAAGRMARPGQYGRSERRRQHPGQEPGRPGSPGGASRRCPPAGTRSASTANRELGATENSFIQENGWNECQKWYLAIDGDESGDTKARDKFPYGDLENVHRGVISAESRAGQYKDHDVESAAHHLLSMLNELM